MKIKRMTATFGSLDHETLELEEGLNILTLPNEGGKSTWCAFLRVMLYGLNTRERDKKGFLADKTRYQPWSGAAMEGELLCSAAIRRAVRPWAALRPFMPTPAHRWLS